MKKIMWIIPSVLFMLVSVSLGGCVHESIQESENCVEVNNEYNEDDVVIKLNVTIPQKLEKGYTVAIASSLNDWDPEDDRWEVEKIDDTHYQCIIDLSDCLGDYVADFDDVTDEDGQLHLGIIYKWLVIKEDASQSDLWSMEELDENGKGMSNRLIIATNGENVYNDVVGRFKIENEGVIVDSNVEGKLVNVRLQAEGLEVNSNRTVRIWLPEGYDADNKDKKYSVLYMHDGQNLFDDSTSYAGEWNVDETITKLMNEGYDGCIVVGIDNSDDRMNELYATFDDSVNTASSYADFIVNVVKPYVDANYNTYSDVDHTGIGGSSMGGEMSLFMGLKYPDIFGFELCFSPAMVYWENEQLTEYMSQCDFTNATNLPKVYIYSGGAGLGSGYANDEATLTKYVDILKDDLINSGYPSEKINTKIDMSQEHCEDAWSLHFEEAFKWLVGIE